MKILFISTLYPSSVHPTQAPFNRQLVAAIAEKVKVVEEVQRVKGAEDSTSKNSDTPSPPYSDTSPSVFVRVIAPIYWLPGREIPPSTEVLDGITVTHPKVFYTPGILREKHGVMYRRSIRKHLRAVIDEFKPDHVIIGFAYPDAVAVAPLCREFGVNYSVQVLGSDFRLRVKQNGFREMVLDELHRAPRIFCPGKALKRDMATEGIDEAKITSFNNGVDLTTRAPALEAQSPLPRVEIAESYDDQSSIDFCNVCSKERDDGQKIVLFVGHLVDVKRPDVLVEAFAKLVTRQVSGCSEHPNNLSTHQLNNCQLVLIGDGGMRKSLEQRVANIGKYGGDGVTECGCRNGCDKKDSLSANSASASTLHRASALVHGREISSRVTFLGDVPHEQVFEWMRKADCLCLTSKSEGMPNVVVEALACGLPVVATDVGEVPFLIEDDVNGYVVGKVESRKLTRPEGERGFVSGAQRSGNAEMGREGVSTSLPKDIADAIRKTLDKKWDHAMISERMKDYTWGNAADTVFEALDS